MKLLEFDIDDERMWVEDNCEHLSIMPEFNEKEAQSMSSYEVREKYPRFCGRCPDCGLNLILYASFTHYLAGDW